MYVCLRAARGEESDTVLLRALFTFAINGFNPPGLLVIAINTGEIIYELCNLQFTRRFRFYYEFLVMNVLRIGVLAKRNKNLNYFLYTG